MNKDPGLKIRTRIFRTAIVLAVAVVLPFAFAGNAAAATNRVGLGKAQRFAVLGGQSVTNAGPTTVVNGDLGVSPGTSITGFPPGQVNGQIHNNDAVAAEAQRDVTTAYNKLEAKTCPAGNDLSTVNGGDLGGQTLTPGVYCFSSTAGLTGTLTLNGKGNPNAVFVFQIGSAITTASNSLVNLVRGTQACNVFWQVTSSAVLGTDSSFTGNVLALTSITVTDGATLRGRALARTGSVTLDDNTVTKTTCRRARAASPCP